MEQEVQEGATIPIATIRADADLRRTWNSWRAMRSRCERKNDVHFGNYGARGITVCERWLKFEPFLADMGIRPAGLTLDRFPNRDGNYEPTNCRWATSLEQSHNSASTGQLIEFQGRAQSVNGWASERRLGKNTIHRRLAAGWSIERALTTPGTKSAHSVIERQS